MRCIAEIFLTGLTLFYYQLDAQTYCLFLYITFIKILYMFRALPCTSSGGLRRNCIYAASGIVTVKSELSKIILLTLSNLIFLPTAYSPALICFGR
jgi:hypothetical protein